MKKHQSYLVLLLALLISSTANAKVNSYVGLYANAGEWSLIPTKSDYSFSLGAAGGLGFLYELQAGPAHSQTRFLFDIGVGADYGMTSFNVTQNQSQSIPNQVDLNGDEFDYIYQLNGRKDQYQNLAVRVPIMFGVQHYRFYMLAGVKVGANIYKNVLTEGTLTTYGDYKEFDDFRNMPEYQFFESLPLKRKSPAKFDMLNLDVSFEIGGRIGQVTDASGFDVPKSKVEYRLAAFADYGVLDIRQGHKGDTQQSLIIPETYNAVEAYNPDGKNQSMVDNMTTNDIITTENFAKSLNNFMVGLKFTVLFQLPEPGQCVICQDAYRSSARRGGGGRGVKYEE